MLTGPAPADVWCADGSRPLKLLVHHGDSAYRSGEQGKPAETGIQRRAWNTPFIVGFGWIPSQAGKTKLIATGGPGRLLVFCLINQLILLDPWHHVA